MKCIFRSIFDFLSCFLESDNMRIYFPDSVMCISFEGADIPLKVPDYYIIISNLFGEICCVYIIKIYIGFVVF